MSVRKRKWTVKGEEREAWVVDYTDQNGKRRLKTFPRKKEADAWKDDMRPQVRAGTHTPDSVSKTVKQAGELWIEQAERDGLERSTTQEYRRALDHYIGPRIGAVKLSRLTVAGVKDFEARLQKDGKSAAMTKKALVCLGALLSHAYEAGLVAQNVARGINPRRRRGLAKRHRTTAAIPTKEEVRAILDASAGRWRPLLLVAIFTGLRASEIRGLRWADVDLKAKTLTVSQRADAWGTIGSPKSDSGRREIPLAPVVVNALKEWRLAAPKGDLDLVFPNGSGNVEAHTNIWVRGFAPIQIAAGVSTPTGKKDDDGKPVMRPKYGIHALRHFAASIFIEQAMNAKRVQTLMGHSSIQVTFDTYGHLFPTPDDDKEMELVQARVLG